MDNLDDIAAIMGVLLVLLIFGSIAFALLYGIFHITSNTLTILPFVKKREKFTLHEFYTHHFHYYNLLTPTEQKRFLVRILIISKRFQLKIAPEIENNSNKVEFMLYAAFTQITFGYDDYAITSFKGIVINPKTFHSKLLNKKVKGLTVNTGYIFYSWEDFTKGYRNNTDKINLALHELAHAIYIDRFHNQYVFEWMVWKLRAKATLEELETSKSSYFRAYGKTNLAEFWAVTVECFFEDPINFKKEYPILYQATATILNQDMVTRIKKVKQ